MPARVRLTSADSPALIRMLRLATASMPVEPGGGAPGLVRPAEPLVADAGADGSGFGADGSGFDADGSEFGADGSGFDAEPGEDTDVGVPDA